MKRSSIIFVVICAFFFKMSIAFAGEKPSRSDPEYLRAKHAGHKTFVTSSSFSEVMNYLDIAIRRCHPSEVDGPYDGILIEKVVKRKVSIFRDDEHSRGYFYIGVSGFWLVPMYLVDVSGDGEGAAVQVYYARDNKMHRAIFNDVDSWLHGNSYVCNSSQLSRQQRKSLGLSP